MNNLVNSFYFNVYKRFSPIDFNEERGAEAVEWVAMVAVLITLLLAVSAGFSGGGERIGTTVVNSIVSWAGKIITGG